jgi:hypothetical protein
MQTGKDTTHTHVIPLNNIDSEERAFPDPQWQPGKRARFPWTGFTALVVVVLCAISSVVVLRLSNGKSTRDWPDKIAPSIILSGFNGVANICFGIAIANGVAITWWRKALNGATIQDLHRSWTFSASVKDIVLGGKYFNFIALAALAAKLTIIDSMLLQRAASRGNFPDPGRFTTINVAANNTMPFTGFLADDSYFDTADILPWFNDNMKLWSGSSGIYANSYTYCNGTCLFQVEGTGFEIDCASEEVALDNGAAAVREAVALEQFYALNDSTLDFDQWTTQSSFEISFELLYGTTGIDGDHSKILMNITTSASNQSSPTSCLGVQTRHICTLRPAIISYPVTVEDTSSSSDSDHIISNMYLGFNTTSYGGMLYYYDAEKDWYDTADRPYIATNKQQDKFIVVEPKDIHETDKDPLTSIGGVFVALSRTFSGSAFVYYNTTTKIYSMSPDGSAVFNYRPTRSTPRGCDFSYEDPLNDVVKRINQLMFSLAMDPWGLNEDFDWNDTRPWDATEYGYTIHYQTNEAYMWGALASMLFCILCVLPSYYGYWQLGREVTLGPFEIANAFRAPVLDHPAAANARVKDLIREVGNRQVKYGEMVQHDASGRLAIAEPEAVRRVHPRLHG